MLSVPDKYHNIQCLRGASVLAVLLYHLGQKELVYWPHSFCFLYLFSLIGHVGVDLFFVISGFVMVAANHRYFGKKNEIGSYLFRRAWRIYPLFWLVCLPKSVWMVCHDKTPLRTFYRGLLLVPPETWKVSHVAWTLSYEVCFYILFALTLLFNFRWLPIFLLTWTGLIVFSEKIPYIASLPDYLNIAFDVINITFIYGAFVAICALKKIFMPILPTAIDAFLILACAALLKHHGLVDFDNDFRPRLLLLGLPSVLVLMAAVSAEKRSGILLPKWLERLGNASYSIYLTHLLFIQYSQSWAAHFSSNGLRAIWIACMIATCLAIGLIVHHLLEKPLLHCIRFLVSNRERKSTTKPTEDAVPAPLASVA